MRSERSVCFRLSLSLSLEIYISHITLNMTKRKSTVQNSSASIQLAVCNICQDSIKTGEEFCCSICKTVYHPSCLGIPESSIKCFRQLLSDTINCPLEIVCVSCKPFFRKLADVPSQLEVISQRLDKLEAEKESVLGKNEKVPGSLQQIVITTVQDTLEAKSKETTAVLLGFAGNEDDNTIKEKVIEFAQKVGFETKRIAGVRRSGPTTKDRSGKIRPKIVKVTCESILAKEKFIKIVNEFSKNRENECNVFARVDLTFNQRQKLRDLYTELNERKNNGETNLYVDRKNFVIKPKFFRA